MRSRCDDTGLPWTHLDEAAHPELIIPGNYVIVGSGKAQAVALVVDITADGIVPVQPRLGTIAANAAFITPLRLAS